MCPICLLPLTVFLGIERRLPEIIKTTHWEVDTRDEEKNILRVFESMIPLIPEPPKFVLSEVLHKLVWIYFTCNPKDSQREKTGLRYFIWHCISFVFLLEHINMNLLSNIDTFQLSHSSVGSEVSDLVTLATNKVSSCCISFWKLSRCVFLPFQFPEAAHIP